jgi:hypothetical protein
VFWFLEFFSKSHPELIKFDRHFSGSNTANYD